MVWANLGLSYTLQHSLKSRLHFIWFSKKFVFLFGFYWTLFPVWFWRTVSMIFCLGAVCLSDEIDTWHFFVPVCNHPQCEIQRQSSSISYDASTNFPPSNSKSGKQPSSHRRICPLEVDRAAIRICFLLSWDVTVQDCNIIGPPSSRIWCWEAKVSM